MDKQNYLLKDTNYDLRDFILMVKNYFYYYLRKSWFILLCTLIFTTAAAYYVKSYKSFYTAKAVFMTNSDSGSPLGGIMQLAGRFGFSTGNREIDCEKIVELLGTRNLVLNAMMTEKEVNGKKDLLINLYEEMMAGESDNNDTLHHLQKKSIDSLTYKDNIIATRVYNHVIKKQLRSSSSKNGLVSVTFSCPDQFFATAFVNTLMDNTVDFYVRKKVEQQQFAFNYIKKQVDSLKTRLNNKEYQLSKWYDNRYRDLKAGSMGATEYIDKVDLDREVEILSIAYAEGLKNMELARMNLIGNTPVIQILDRPLIPLEEQKPFLKTFLMYGILFGLFFSVVLLTFYKLIVDALKSIAHDS